MKTALCVALAALLVATSSTVTSAVTVGGRTCATTDLLATLSMNTGAYATCLQQRCTATTGAAPTAPSADGQCDGSGTAEAASTQTCDTILDAFSEYYACVLRAAKADASAPPAIRDAYDLYLHTPGVPYHVSELPCYACTNFDSVFATTALPGRCTAQYTCESCCGQNPTTNWFGSPGKGYNRVLCGNGCITALMMMAFTVLSALILMMCCCFCPSPSLNATVERVAREEAEEKARVAATLSSDDDRARAPRRRRADRSEPAAAQDDEYPTEPQQQSGAAGNKEQSEDEL